MSNRQSEPFFYTEVVSSAKLEIFVARFQAPRFFKKNTHLFPVHSCHSHSHSTVMPISLKKSKTNSGAAVASSAAAETPKKSFLPKGSKSTAGKVGQSGAAHGSTPGTKRKYGASNNKNAVLVKWGVPLINDDEYSRSKLLRDLSYKVNGVEAVPITYFNRITGETEKKIFWDGVGFNVKNVEAKYIDESDYKSGVQVLKLVVSKETGEGLLFRIKTYIRMFWEYTEEGKSLEVYGGADALEWRETFTRHFEKIHPGKPMMETLHEMWQNKYGKNSEDAPMPASGFDLAWEFRKDPGFIKKTKKGKKETKKSLLFAERVLYQPETDDYLIPVEVKQGTTFLWPHRNKEGNVVKDQVPVEEIRRKDVFGQIRIMLSAGSTPNGQPSANIRAILGNKAVPWILKGTRGPVYIPRDQETPEQREEREVREAKQNAEFEAQCAENTEQRCEEYADM